jgi:hypothetical protein
MAELRGLLEAHMDRPDVITGTVEFKPGEPAAINLLTHVVGAPLPPTAGPRHGRPLDGVLDDVTWHVRRLVDDLIATIE